MCCSGCSCRPSVNRSSSASEKGLHRTNQTVRSSPDTFCRTGSNGDVTVNTGTAAETEVGRAVGQINLLDVASWRQIFKPFDDFHHTGAALTHTAAVVEVVDAVVGIDARIKGRFAQIGTLNASNFLAFLLILDGGHGALVVRVRTNLQASAER